jgi:hypothetical protein
MTQITIDVPDEMKEDLVKALALRKAIANSQLTEKDAEELTDKINEAMWKRHKQYDASLS